MTFIEFSKIMDQAKREVNSEYKKELENIRNKAYELNKEVGFYDIAGMDYDDFLECMKHYSYEDRMRVAYSFYIHIKLLDNIILRREKHENICSQVLSTRGRASCSPVRSDL